MDAWVLGLDEFQQLLLQLVEVIHLFQHRFIFYIFPVLRPESGESLWLVVRHFDTFEGLSELLHCHLPRLHGIRLAQYFHKIAFLYFFKTVFQLFTLWTIKLVFQNFIDVDDPSLVGHSMRHVDHHLRTQRWVKLPNRLCELRDADVRLLLKPHVYFQVFFLYVVLDDGVLDVLPWVVVSHHVFPFVLIYNFVVFSI